MCLRLVLTQRVSALRPQGGRNWRAEELKGTRAQGLPDLQPLKRLRLCGGGCPGGRCPVAEVMFRCWHRLVGPRDGALSEELGKVGLGRWGDGRGSPVNKLGPEPGNHLLLIELVWHFFFISWQGERPRVCTGHF